MATHWFYIIILIVNYAWFLAAGGGVCSSDPYSSFLSLSTYDIAELYCTLHYPIPPVTITAATDPHLELRAIRTTFARVTDPPSRLFAPGYLGPPGPPGPPGHGPPGHGPPGRDPPGHGPPGRDPPGHDHPHPPGRPCEGPCKTWSSLITKNPSFISTLCSCIETPKTVTVTATTSKATTTTSKATTTTTSAASTTSNPTVTITKTITTTDTTTSTLTVTETPAYPSPTCPAPEPCPPCPSPPPPEEPEPYHPLCDPDRTDQYIIENIEGGGKCGCNFTSYCNTGSRGTIDIRVDLTTPQECTKYVDSTPGLRVSDPYRGECYILNPDNDNFEMYANVGEQLDIIDEECKTSCDGPKPPPTCDPTRTDQYIIENVPGGGTCGCKFTTHCNTDGSGTIVRVNRQNGDSCRAYVDSHPEYTVGNYYDHECFLLQDDSRLSYGLGEQVDVVDIECKQACTTFEKE